MYSPFPSVLPFTADKTNAASAVRDIELRLPCHGGARRKAPLFASANGEAYTHRALDAWLRD
eukprot:5466495-Pleurochrysis_carterae.AAC.1